MLTPQTLQKLPDDLIDLVSEVQTDIIKSIAKKLVKADYLTPSAEWQLYKASQLKMSTKEITAMLAEFTGKSKRQISKLYTDACKEAINNDAKIYRTYGKDCSAALRSVALSNTLKAGVKNANGMTKNLCKSMVESSQATVTHLMDKAWLKVQSGAFTYQDAIYDAVVELAKQGIATVTYPSGKTDWADVAVRRAVMTGISQTAGQMQLDLAAEMDCDLVEVTAHMGARPSHALWQGKVYSISGKSKKYPKLSTATGYGTGDGLKGWNCRHDFYPFFEGISERANLPVDVTENNRQYELSQKQRAMERSIRATKRRLAAYDGAISETEDEVLKMKSYGIENPPKSLDIFENMKYNSSPEYKLMNAYITSVKKGKISPLVGYDHYKKLHNEINNSLVGLTTTNGIEITGQSDHFIERVIGVIKDPDTGKKRLGVELQDIQDALTNGKAMKPKISRDKNGNILYDEDGKPKISQLFVTDKCAVSINPETGVLIQCNPK